MGRAVLFPRSPLDNPQLIPLRKANVIHAPLISLMKINSLYLPEQNVDRACQQTGSRSACRKVMDFGIQNQEN